MANTVYTNDGKYYVVFDSRSIVDLVDQYVGKDVSRYINALITEAEKEKEELEDDRDRVAWCFDDFVHEMKDELECLQEMMHKDRVKKNDLMKIINRAYDKVLNQI